MGRKRHVVQLPQAAISGRPEQPYSGSNERPVSSKPFVVALDPLQHLLDRHDLGDSRCVPSLYAQHFPGHITMEQKEAGIVARTADREAGDATQPLAVNDEIESAGEGG